MAEASIHTFFQAIHKKAKNRDKDILELTQFQATIRHIFSEIVDLKIEGARAVKKIKSGPHRKAVKFWNQNAERYLMMAFAGQHYPKFLKYYMKDDLDDNEWPSIPCAEIHDFAKEFSGSDQRLFPIFFKACYAEVRTQEGDAYAQVEYVPSSPEKLTSLLNLQKFSRSFGLIQIHELQREQRDPETGERVLFPLVQRETIGEMLMAYQVGEPSDRVEEQE